MRLDYFFMWKNNYRYIIISNVCFVNKAYDLYYYHIHDFLSEIPPFDVNDAKLQDVSDLEDGERVPETDPAGDQNNIS